jgi:hypothetical protein
MSEGRKTLAGRNGTIQFGHTVRYCNNTGLNGLRKTARFKHEASNIWSRFANHYNMTFIHKHQEY